MLPELPPVVSNILIALIAIGLGALFWRGTRGSKSSDTIVMRSALMLLLGLFIVAAVLGSVHEYDGHGRVTTTAPAPSRGASTEGVKQPAPAPQSTPAPAPVGPPRQEAAAPPPPPPRPAPPAAAPPPQATPSQATPAPAPQSTTTPPPVAAKQQTVQEVIEQLAKQSGAQSPTRAAPPQPDRAAEAWDIVPVYYGTDRATGTTDGRTVYGADRARRLEFGRALITVPKTHEVPNVERPWVYRLPFTRIVVLEEQEDAAKHFTLKELKASSREELAQIVRDRLAASSDYKDQALVFIHGFNTAFENALFRTAQIAYDLKFDGAPFMYSWPSKGQLGLQDYSYDRESSGQSEPYLRQFLEFVTRDTGARKVNIIAHSMGNQLLLNVLRDLKRNAPPDVTIGQVILAAPDVDRDTFEFMAKEISGLGQSITMLAASNDRALEASRRFWGGVPRAGDVPAEGPLVIAGIDTIDISRLSTEMLSLNHNGYADKRQLIDDMRLLLKDGTRPPDKRSPSLERVTTSKGEFWRFPAVK